MPRDHDPAPITPSTQRLGFLLYRVGLMVSRVYEARMRPLGFAPAEVGLLTYLASEGADHVRAIARSLGVSPQTVVNLTRSLEKRGLVSREASSSDQRAITVRLTQPGRRALARADALAKELDAELAETVGFASVNGMMQGLSALLASAGKYKMVEPE